MFQFEDVVGIVEGLGDAESIGLGGRTAQNLFKIIEAAHAGNEKARAALDAVNDRKKSIDKAFKEVAAR
jgi:hypothetical protein